MPTKDDYARAVIAEGQRRGITPRGIVIALATTLVESNLTMYANAKVPESMALPHDAVGSDGYSVGLFQQQVRRGDGGQWWWGDAATCMDPTKSAGLFYDRLARLNYNTGDPGAVAQSIQRSAYPDRYGQRMAEAQSIYDRLTSGAPMPVSGDPVWLEDVLRPALGDRLKTLPGWESDGVGGTMADIRGIIWHHTGNAAEKPESISVGRPDLKGPLAQIHIAPDGIVTIVAVGPCNHAGQGGGFSWLPNNDANRYTIGIECAWPTIREDGTYNATERWPDAQIISMRDTGAALTKYLGVDVSRNISHKEWAGAAQGKWDPGNLDMNWFRGEIQKDIDGFVFPGEQASPQPGPILPPDYAKEVWDQLRIEWPQLGGQTLVNAVAEIRDKVCDVQDYANWKAAQR